MWQSAKLRGYLCAFLDFGFANSLVARTIVEIQSAMPQIFCDYALTIAWGYKYADGTDGVDGIDVHGDAAAVNVNCWIVSEENILDPTTGKLGSSFDKFIIERLHLFWFQRWNGDLANTASKIVEY